MCYKRLFGWMLFALSGTTISYSCHGIAEAPVHSKEINFDVDSLRSLGYGKEIAEYFKAGSLYFPGEHHVVIKVNGAGSYSEMVTIGDKGQLCVTPELLKKLGLKAEPFTSDCADLTILIPGAKVTSWPGKYEIEVLVPEDAFDKNLRNNHLMTGGFAMMNNYRIYGMRMDNQMSQEFYQGQFETGINLKNWILRNNSSFSSGKGNASYQFNETTLSRGIESFKSILQLGQISTQGTLFGGTPINGFQLYSDSALQGQGQLLVPVTGIAETPSTIEIKQNGRLLYRTLVPAGPFQLNRVNGMTNGQPLDVSVIQNDSRTSTFQITTTPADVNIRSPLNYQFALGKYRKLSGSQDVDAPILASLEGDIAFNKLQVSAGGVFAEAYQSAGGRYGYYWESKYPGSASFGVTAARSRREQGMQVDGSLGLALNPFYLGLSKLYRGEAYPTLQAALQRSEPASIDEDNWISSFNSGALKFSTSVSLGWADTQWGRFGYSLGLNQFYQHKEDTLLNTFSYGKKFGDVTMNLSFQTASDRDNRYFLSASIPFDKRASMSSQMQRYQGENNYTTSFSHKSDEFGQYSLGASHRGEQNRMNGTLHATTAYSNLSVNGSWGNDGTRSIMFTTSGALAYTGGTFASSPYALGDTFGIVSVPGQSGVRVKTMGSGTTVTNHFGTAAIPSIPTNRKATVQLDTKGLPLNVRLDTTSFDVAVARGTVIAKEIKANVIRQLLLTVKMINGELAPTGTSALDKGGTLVGVVMGNGNLMLSNEQIDKPLLLRIPNQGDCRLIFTPPTYFDPNAIYEESDAECK